MEGEDDAARTEQNAQGARSHARGRGSRFAGNAGGGSDRREAPGARRQASNVQVDAHHQALLRHSDEGGSFIYVTTRPETSTEGTDWSSAGIGAGAAFGVILLGSTALLVGRKKLVSA